MRSSLTIKGMCGGAAFVVIALTVAGCGGDEATAEHASSSATTTNPPPPDTATATNPTATSASLDLTEAVAFEYGGPPTPESVEQAEKIIKALRSKYGHSNVPQVLTAPYDRDGLAQYARVMNAFRISHPIDLAWAEQLDVASLPNPNDHNHFLTDRNAESLRSVLGGFFAEGQGYAYSLKYTRANLVGNVDSNLMTLGVGANADPSNDGDLKNKLAREDRVQLYRNAGRLALDLAAFGAALDQVMGDSETDWAAKSKQATQMLATLEEKVQAAAKLIVPPKDINRPELAKVAAEVLSRDRYGLPAHVRLIVNAPIKKHNRVLYTLDEHYIHRGQSIWEEFQATTIEKADDGKHYLFYNDIVKYEQAASQTTTGKWILGGRFRGSPIVEENFKK